jgi:hypothetical protein
VTALELITKVERCGGELTMNGGRIHYRLPASAAEILEELRSHREEVRAALSYYDWRVGVASDVISNDYPEGLVSWLGENRPAMYRKLIGFQMGSFPDRIDKTWGHAPFEEFDVLCREWVLAYRNAVAIYRQHVKLAGAVRFLDAPETEEVHVP